MSDICKLTGSAGRFVKCHLYPQSFYSVPPDGEYMVTIGGGERHKRSWTGIYDDELVITETEAFFADLDRYAFELLAPNLPHKEFWSRANERLGQEDKITAALFSEFDADKLQLFFVSVIWRWAASSRPEAAMIDLGPYSEAAREVLVSRTPRPDLFGVQLARFTDATAFPSMPPVRGRFNQANAFKMLLGCYQAVLRCDKRRSTGTLGKFEIAKGRPLVVANLSFEQSPLRKQMRDMIKEHEGEWGYPWPGKKPDA
jgi:hypothetical protein